MIVDVAVVSSSNDKPVELLLMIAPVDLALLYSDKQPTAPHRISADSSNWGHRYALVVYSSDLFHANR